MNRFTHIILLNKSILLLFIVLFCNHASATTFEAVADGLDFKFSSSWTGNPDLINFTNISQGDNFIIDGGKTINITSDITVPNLKILGGSTLKVITTNNITITITDSLYISESGASTPSIINFGTGNVTLIVKGNLFGATYSEIIHNPSAGKIQKLILEGAENSLYTFISPFNSPSAGTSIVTYERAGDQTVFHSEQYATLELKGSGIKTLQGPGNPGAEAIVHNKLTIQGCKLKLTTLNFAYQGTESNLSCTDGWIYTNGAGTYSSNNTTDNIRTFPVGTATSMQAVSLTNILNIKVSVRFGTNTLGTIPNSGLGVWYISPATQTPTKITFLKPVHAPALTSVSNIAMYAASLWNIQPTTYTAASIAYSTTNSITLPNTTTAFSIFTCPTFTATPPGPNLSDASVGMDYTKMIQISGGTGPYEVASSAAATGYTFTEQPASVTINGKPLNTNPVPVSFTSQDATGCQTAFTYTITPVITSTTWNGSSWSNGAPTATMAVILTGNYSTAIHGITLTAKTLTVSSGAVLTIAANGKVTVSETLKNQGTINKACAGQLSYIAPITGNPVNSTTILPVELPHGLEGQPYLVQFSLSDNPAATAFSITGMPSNFGLNGSELSSDDPEKGGYSIIVTYSANGCTISEQRTLKIAELSSPNLAILNIPSKTFGDDPFAVRTYSRSDGAVTYTLSTASACASINALSGELTIKCAGQITVIASQQAKGLYKAGTATKTFTVVPANGKIAIRRFAFIKDEAASITAFTRLNPNPTITFDQQTGFSNATVQSTSGTVLAKETGTFSVRISLAATANYTAFDSVYVFSVVTARKPPVAVSDTIILETGKDTTVSILNNDKGMTAVIKADKTDIDMENSGVQIKFYATELGNFLIDTNGNLTVKPFYGFIGTSRIGYTITDADGLTSGIAYVDVTVKPPYVIPALKANEVMTPNNDNLNDALVVANTDLNKENSLTVIDKAGNTVYERTNYQNDWEGFDKNNNKLESGTYFYIFKEKYTGRQLSNYIQIVTQ